MYKNTTYDNIRYYDVKEYTSNFRAMYKPRHFRSPLTRRMQAIEAWYLLIH